MLTSPSKVHELVAAVQKSVILSKGWELSTFAAQLQSLSSGNIDFYTIPTNGPAKVGGADVIKVDPAEVHQFVAALTNDGSVRPDTPGTGGEVTTPTPTPTTTTTTTTSASSRTTTSLPRETGGFPTQVSPGAVTVDVRNASQTKGLAGTVQDRLVRQGFRRGTVGDTAVQDVSEIRYPAGEQYAAQLVASALGGQLALEPDLSLPAGHVQVMIGTDYPTTQGFGHPLGKALPTTSVSTASSSTSPAPPIVAGAHACVN
jgi:hypothetical protein